MRSIVRINILALLLIFSINSVYTTEYRTQNNTLDILSNKIKSGVTNITYNLHTLDTKINMDSLKLIYDSTDRPFGVFHSVNSTTHYSQLYYSQIINANDISKWWQTLKLSQRGSQGTIFVVPEGGYLIGYQLENHQRGNTIAIRYYESQDKIKVNNYLYQYQLIQLVSKGNVRNIGTPSLEKIQILNKGNYTKYNQYTLSIKFHYSPDGSHDLPGYGEIHLIPLRDFIDNNTGQWIGGSKQNYSDWDGKTDNLVMDAMRLAGCSGKIGQRDYFIVDSEQYYIYECNVNVIFDWKSWRIYLYSVQLNQAHDVGLQLDGDTDIANPHISLKLRQQSKNMYQFIMSYFLPSQGTPGTAAKPGQAIMITEFSYP